MGSTPAGLWDKYSCTIQHWTSTADIISGVWSWKESVIVDSMMPCYSLSGRVENGVFVLYTSTSGNDYSSKAPNSVPYPSTVPFPATGVDGNGGYKTGTSKLYKVNTATKAVTAVVTAPANTVYRSVAIPPQQRGNYTCPAGQVRRALAPARPRGPHRTLSLQFSRALSRLLAHLLARLPSRLVVRRHVRPHVLVQLLHQVHGHVRAGPRPCAPVLLR